MSAWQVFVDVAAWGALCFFAGGFVAAGALVLRAVVRDFEPESEGRGGDAGQWL